MALAMAQPSPTARRSYVFCRWTFPEKVYQIIPDFSSPDPRAGTTIPGYSSGGGGMIPSSISSWISPRARSMIRLACS